MVEIYEVTDEEAAAPHGHACSSCGAPIEQFDRFCTACGTESAADDVVTATVVPDQKHLRCENCGAEVATDPDQRSYVCPFCDSTYVVEFSLDQTNRQPPEFVIGFGVTPDQALEKFRDWLKQSNWFRPGDLTSAKIEEKMRGVYLPFWSFAMLAQSRWSASIGENWTRTETYTTTDSKGKTVTRTRSVTETEWWDLAGRHHRYYTGYLVSGSRGLPQNQADRIMPFQLPALKRYEPFFLAGWLSEEYSVDREQAQQLCQQKFYEWERGNIGRFLPGDSHRNLQVETRFSEASSDLILLPVYLLSYSYEKKLYRFLINGQTGRCAGDKPLSWKRILLAIAGVVAVIAAAFAIFGILSAIR